MNVPTFVRFSHKLVPLKVLSDLYKYVYSVVYDDF